LYLPAVLKACHLFRARPYSEYCNTPTTVRVAVEPGRECSLLNVKPSHCSGIDLCEPRDVLLVSRENLGKQTGSSAALAKHSGKTVIVRIVPVSIYITKILMSVGSSSLGSSFEVKVR
jgi:hypothetical protein